MQNAGPVQHTIARFHEDLEVELKPNNMAKTLWLDLVRHCQPDTVILRKTSDPLTQAAIMGRRGADLRQHAERQRRRLPRQALWWVFESVTAVRWESVITLHIALSMC